METALS